MYFYRKQILAYYGVIFALFLGCELVNFKYIFLYGVLKLISYGRIIAVCEVRHNVNFAPIL